MSKPPHVGTVFKRCISCQVTKPAAAFFPTSTTIDRLTHRCRECTFASAPPARQIHTPGEVEHG